jgi:nitrite reductase/ring-hydroxylating ferredoxin subunit/uncharacterized membrane protein
VSDPIEPPPDAQTTTDEQAQAAEAPAVPTPWYDPLSDALQRGIKPLVGANLKPPRRLKTLLSGTWLGHPLHPLFTDVPIGAWILTVILDIIWLVSPSGNAWAARGAQVTVLIGVLGALGAFYTGISDWSDTYGSERSVGLLHGSLNTLAILIFAISTILRFSSGPGDTTPAAILGFIGFAVMSVAAYFGGTMVFDKGVGVNHTAWEPGTDDFVPVVAQADVGDQSLVRVVAGGVPVILLRLGEQYHAIAATCSHAGGPLDEGELQGDVVQCPWHGSRFNMRTGRVVTGPATVSQPRYAVRVRDGQIEVKRLGGH